MFLEGYGGGIPWTAISAKVGTGVNELLDLILLVSEIEELTGDPIAPADGIIIESNLDTKKGISATVIIKDGRLKKGDFVVSGTSFTPVRIIENFLGKQIDEATFSSPVRIVGWDSLPHVGSSFFAVKSKKDALEIIEKNKDVKEIDVNPLFVLENDVAAADIRIISD